MSQPDVKGKPRVPNWTVNQDRVLLNLLLDQFKKNYSSGGAFKQHVWTDILIPFNEATRLTLTQLHLKNRWKNLKKTYHLYETLRSRSGWGWDDSRQLPIPPDENAWQAAIASNSRYATIYGKPYIFREEMDLLCSKATCRGSLSFGSNQEVDLERRRSFGDDESPRRQFSEMGLQSQSTPIEEEDSFDPFAYYPSTQPSVNFNMARQETPPVTCDAEDEVSSPQKGHASGSSSQKNKKRKGKFDGSFLQDYCKLNRDRLEIAKLLFPASSSATSAGTEECTVKECLKKVKTLPGCTPEILYCAANLFKQSENRVVFMALEDEDKIGWISHNSI